MAGASDPTIAAAIAAQSKSIESQSKTLAAQSKLLQQLCDRLESHDECWRQLESAVGKNVDNIAALTNRIESAGDVNPQADLGRDLWAQLDAQVAELQSVALDQIDSIAANTTTRVAALENVNAVFDAWRPRIENSVDTIKSSVEEVRTELGRVSRFLERAALDDPSNRAGILGPFASATERVFPAVPNVDGPIGTRSAPTFRETGLGVFLTHTISRPMVCLILHPLSIMMILNPLLVILTIGMFHLFSELAIRKPSLVGL